MSQTFGIQPATSAGTIKIPLPMTLETIIDAPSIGPRRRTSESERVFSSSTLPKEVTASEVADRSETQRQAATAQHGVWL